MISLRKIAHAVSLLVVITLLAAAPTKAAENNLIDAAIGGDLSRVRASLAAKADVNAKLANGVTALMAASQNGHLDVVQALLAKGADVNAKANYGLTALIQASQAGHLDVVRVLLAKGADVNSRGNRGSTALILASEHGHSDVVRALLAKGADIYAKNNGDATALLLASQNGHLDVVQALLAADVNARTPNGSSALIQASQNGHLDVVRALLTEGADVDAKASDGSTALIRASQNGHLDVVQALLDKRADVNATASNGATALIMASYTGRGDVVHALLTKGADVNATLHDGKTALTLARNSDVRAVLIQAGAIAQAPPPVQPLPKAQPKQKPAAALPTTTKSSAIAYDPRSITHEQVVSLITDVFNERGYVSTLGRRTGVRIGSGGTPIQFEAGPVISVTTEFQPPARGSNSKKWFYRAIIEDRSVELRVFVERAPYNLLGVTISSELTTWAPPDMKLVLQEIEKRLRTQ